MELTQEQLDQLEKFAAAYLEVSDIATLMDLDEDKFRLMIFKMDNPVYRAFKKGRLLTKTLINKSIIDCAKAGSGPAQQEALRMLQKLKNTDPDYELA